MHLLAHLLVAFAGLAFIFAQSIQQSTPPVPAGYTYIGCYTDSAAARGLTGNNQNDVDGNTALECAAFCGGTIYFGLEFSSQCFCGNTLGPTSVPTAESNCMDPTYTCPGHPNDYYCGGNNAFAVYQINPAAAVPTVTVTTTIIQSPTCAVGGTSTMTVAPSAVSSKSTFHTSTSPKKSKSTDKNDSNGNGGDKKENQ